MPAPKDPEKKAVWIKNLSVALTGKKHIMTQKKYPKRSAARTGKKYPKLSAALKGKPHPWMAGEKNSQKLPEVRQKSSVAKKKNWLDSEYRENQLKAMAKGLQITPNKPEKLLIHLFNKLFPGECKYTGDGSHPIGGKWPDFIVVGQKKVIEFNGDFYHGPKKTGRTNSEEEQRQIRHYAKHGYQTLVIWEQELKKIKTMCERVLEFMKGD